MPFEQAIAYIRVLVKDYAGLTDVDYAFEKIVGGLLW